MSNKVTGWTNVADLNILFWQTSKDASACDVRYLKQSDSVQPCFEPVDEVLPDSISVWGILFDDPFLFHLLAYSRHKAAKRSIYFFLAMERDGWTGGSGMRCNVSLHPRPMQIPATHAASPSLNSKGQLLGLIGSYFVGYSSSLLLEHRLFRFLDIVLIIIGLSIDSVIVVAFIFVIVLARRNCS